MSMKFEVSVTNDIVAIAFIYKKGTNMASICVIPVTLV